EKVFILEKALEDFHENGVIDPILKDFQKKKGIASSLISGTINVKGIEQAVSKMRKQLFKIEKDDFNLTKRLFDILDVPYIDSFTEAETTCADLCLQEKVDGVLSEDTDVLAYGAP